MNRENWSSAYFKPDEVACHCCGRVNISSAFMYKLDRLREYINAPIIVTSGCRCINHNREVGGAENSYHLCDVTAGRAADIHAPGMDLFKFFLICNAYFKGVGLYPRHNFVHVDMRLKQYAFVQMQDSTLRTLDADWFQVHT